MHLGLKNGPLCTAFSFPRHLQRRYTSPLSVKEGSMGEKWPIQFCLRRVTSTVSVGIFYVPQMYDMGQTALLPLRRKACWGFFCPKNPTASARFEPASLGTRGQHANHWTTEAACSGVIEVYHYLEKANLHHNTRKKMLYEHRLFEVWFLSYGLLIVEDNA